MQLFKTSTVIVLATFAFISCGGKGKKTNGSSSKLEGAWEIKRAEGGMADMNVGTVYEFKGNKLVFGKGGFNNPGSTIITDSTFSFQADGNELKFMYDYHFSGDTLVVEMQNSGGQVFYMVKK